ncbi:MAG: hypothetical protein J5526_01415 [Bacteroidales bacterium]|nr:hypothetical protein [Bacteroidales bacterium]
MNKRNLFILAILMVISATVCAQSSKHTSALNENTYSVALDVRSYGDSVVLRWTPDDAALWSLGNANGWKITRTGGKKNTAKVVKVVKPWDLAKIRSSFGASNVEAGLIAQSLYAPSSVSRSLADDPATLIEYVCRVRNEQAARQALVSMLADRDARYAEAAALRYVDRDVEEGAVYEYTIAYAGETDVFECREVSHIVRNNKFRHDRMPSLPQPAVKQIGTSSVAVYWPETDYCGYFIERSLRGAGVTDTAWHVLNSAPIVKLDKSETSEYPFIQITKENVVYIDSLAPGQIALYRVRAYDRFSTLSGWSISESFTMPESRPLASPEFVQLVPADSNSLLIQWRVPEGVSYGGFVVAFAKSFDDVWTKVSGKLKASELSFKDTLAAGRGIGYYRIYAFDSLGRLASSNMMPNLAVDISAPAAPQALRASASLVKSDVSGMRVNNGLAAVALSWNAAGKNAAADLIGYLLFSSERREGPYGQVSSAVVTGNSTTDTVSVKGISSSAYYYLVAVDSRFNHSLPSDTVSVLLPDIVNPEPCVWKSTTPVDGKTAIKWYKSTSTDVVKYNIYTQPAGTSNWQWVATVDTIEIGASPYVTYNVPNDGLVFALQYAVEAIDHSGNSSGRGGIVSLTPDASAQAGVKLKAKYNRKSSSVALTWQYSAKPQSNFFGIIYRTAEGEAPVAVGSFKPSQTSFTDSRLPKAKSVAYHVVLKSSQSAVSKPSSAVKVALR